MIDAALLLAGQASGAGIYSIPYIVLGKCKFSFGNTPAYKHLPGREIGFKLVHFPGGTGRDEYIEDIWGNKLGQVFTSDFNIDEYRQLLLELVNIALTDSTRQNIKNTFKAYFPTIEAEEVVPDEVYVYAGDKVLSRQPILRITKVEVNAGSGYVERPTTDYELRKDVNPATAQTENALDMLKFVANVPNPGDSVRVTYVINTLNIAIIDYWKNPDLFINSFFFAVVSLLLMIFTGRAYDIQKDQEI